MIGGDEIEGKGTRSFKHINSLEVLALLFVGESHQVVQLVEQLGLAWFEAGQVYCSLVGGDGLGIGFFVMQGLADQFVEL